MFRFTYIVDIIFDPNSNSNYEQQSKSYRYTDGDCSLSFIVESDTDEKLPVPRLTATIFPSTLVGSPFCSLPFEAQC